MSTHVKLDPDSASWLVGGGEMGALMRAMNWEQTPLGPSETWSPSLKMMARFLLANRFPLLLWWGPEFCQLYNDAYRPILGTKHPQFLGRPVSECWSEIWHILRPLIETPFNGGPATWMEDIQLEINRYGYIEESHFTIAYSPVPDETVPSGIGGVLATVHEISEKVVGERRIVVLRDLGARAVEAKTAEGACKAAAATLAKHPMDVPFALLYLIDNEAKQLRLAGAAGVESGSDISPSVISLELGERQLWPVASAVAEETTKTVEDLNRRFGSGVPKGPWSDPPTQAVITPIRSNVAHQPAGVLIVGVSARLQLDQSYLSFIDLAATQIATAVANARAYEEERKRAEALAEIDRAKIAFFSNVSHEFRTPLTLMLGPLQDLLADQKLPEAVQEQLSLAHRNSHRLLKLVNTLLDFSRIESGRIEATYEPTELSQATAELASVFRAAVEHAGLEFTVDCAPLDDLVYVDREMWEKIVLNLISNAFKFTFDGSIKIKLQQSDGMVHLSVSDTGTGIPPAELPHLFERFHRVKGARGRSYEGSGIGLALVQELVKLHSGNVSVQTEIDRGSTFTVSIPVGMAHLPPDRIGAQRHLVSTGLRGTSYVDEALRWLKPDDGKLDNSVIPETNGSYGQLTSEQTAPRYKIVLADDNADMRDYVKRLLHSDYEVTEVSNGLEALRAVREHKPDLVLADVMMPELDGFGLVSKLRSDDQLKAIPIILLSARAGDDSRVEGIEAGADDYLVKPFAARELLARVGGTIALANMRREVEAEKAALRDSEGKYRTVLGSMDEGLMIAEVVFDKTGKRAIDYVVLETNEAFYKHTGLPHGIVGKTIREIMVGGEVPWLGIYGEVALSGEPIRFEYEITIEPLVGWYDIFIQRIGEPEQHRVAVMFQDITARKKVEESIARQNERLSLLWEAAGVLLSTNKPDAMLSSLFEKIRRTLSLDVYFNFMVTESGDSLRLLSYAGVDEKTAQSISQLEFGQAVCGRVALTRKPIVATCIQDSNESMVQLVKGFGVRAYACNPLLAGRRLIGTLSFASRTRDRFDQDEIEFLETISKYVTAAYERLHLIEQLQDQDRRKDEFLATLAHELRNPLAPMHNGLQLIRLAANNPSTLEQARAMMERQLRQMKRLVDDLLDVSRISRNKLELRKEFVELSAIVRSATETSRPLIEAAHQDLEVSLPPGPILLDGDPVRLAQAFSNLLNNASKYSEKGSRIWLQAEQRGDEVVVRVRDKGIGIPADKLPRIFDIFMQVDLALERSQGGLGIGLTLVKQLVQMHGGSVEVQSDGPGKGSEFVVRLPLIVVPKTSTQVETKAASKTSTQSRRILVADDNGDSAESLSMMLELLGHRVETAHDGVAAVEVAKTFLPELVFLDLGMPRMNGYDAARVIRSLPECDGVVLVALTGWGQEEDKRRSQEAGFDFHIVKPIDFAAVEKLLD